MAMPGNGTYVDPDVLKQLEAPMPWIGMYAAAASLICTLAMAADILHGFWSRKYWFPSKYFSLNATSLTLLAVAMKLPMDLTTKMHSVTDRLAKVSSHAFMSTAMANFLTSLGSMDDNNVMMNVTALGIMVITITGNVCIQVIQMHSYLSGRRAFSEESLAVVSMLILLMLFISSALMIPSTKRYLEPKYHEMHKSALNEEQLVDMRRVSSEKLKVLIKKYWVMAETSSPQFVIARSVTSTTSGVVSLLTAFILLEAEIRMAMKHGIFDQSYSSNYKWSTKWILLFQTVGVIVGTIAPASRWLVAINYRSTGKARENIRSAFIVEGYWTQKMAEWRESSCSLQIRHLKSRKVLHDLKGLILKFCISVQYLIVLASKLVLLVSICVTSPVISFLNYVSSLRQKSVSDSGSSRDHRVYGDSSANPGLDIRHYVMLLEGEVELPTETLNNIYKEVDEVIEKGRRQNPKNLLKLLSKSCNFQKATEFDSHQVPTPHSQDIPYCWSLPVVTLTSIALAIPNVEKSKSNRLLNSVTEGLRFVKLIDKSLDEKGGLTNIRSAADVAWVKVELYRKWQNKDLHETSIKGKNAQEILQQLQERAEKIVEEFKREAGACVMRNPLNWPAKVIAANSMYSLSRTILMKHGGDESYQTDEELFEKLSIMIADMLAACFSNLPRAITMKCHRNAIEKREKSVRQAAVLLGEAEEILALLQQHELPSLAPDQAAYIEEWRALIELENKISQELFSRPNIEMNNPSSTTEHITIKVEG